MKKIALCYVHPEYLHHRFVDSRDALLKQNRIVRASKLSSGPGVARNRNAVAYHVLHDPQIEYLLWVDADMVFTPDDLDGLLGAKESFIGASCVRVNEDGTTTNAAVVWNAEEKGFRPWIPENEDTIQPVDGMGMAFTLIHRDVYADIGFEAGRPHRERLLPGKGVLVGEDVSMCQHAIAAGYQPKLHTGVKVGHIKTSVFYHYP